MCGEMEDDEIESVVDEKHMQNEEQNVVVTENGPFMGIK
jgi:hypothetical protein